MLKIFKKIIFYFIVFYLTSFLVWTGYLFLHGRDAAILVYHSIGEQIPEYNAPYLSEVAFKKQMDFLYRHHYRVISLMDLVKLLREKKKIPPKTVVLTFDDGYRNNYTKVFSILKQYHFPATIFIITGALGKNEFVTAQMIKEMSDSGLIAIGAHTKSHPYLPSIKKDEKRLHDEIYGSKEVLEKILKKPVEAFCYPIGGYTPRIEKMVRSAGYKVAVTTLPRRHGFAHKDLFALKRIKITEKSKDPVVFFIQTSGYFLRMKEMGGRTK